MQLPRHSARVDTPPSMRVAIPRSMRLASKIVVLPAIHSLTKGNTCVGLCPQESTHKLRSHVEFGGIVIIGYALSGLDGSCIVLVGVLSYHRRVNF